MILTNKLLPVALIAALIGGSVGAIVMHKSQPATAENAAPTNTLPASYQTGETVPGSLTPQQNKQLIKLALRTVLVLLHNKQVRQLPPEPVLQQELSTAMRRAALLRAASTTITVSRRAEVFGISTAIN